MPRRQRFKPSRKPKPAIEPNDPEMIPSDTPAQREEPQRMPVKTEEQPG